MMTHPSTASLKPMNMAATLKYFALSDWHDALISARAAASSGLSRTNPELSSAWHAAASSSTEAATMARAAYWAAQGQDFRNAFATEENTIPRALWAVPKTVPFLNHMECVDGLCLDKRQSH
jgi:hypothetical protein